MKRQVLRGLFIVALGTVLAGIVWSAMQDAGSPAAPRPSALKLPSLNSISPDLLPPTSKEGTEKVDRGKLLPTLYLSQVALQAGDVVSTRVALGLGAREANAVMQQNLGATIATKALTTALTIYVVDRQAKRNRKAAIVTMAIANGLMAAVVVHNVQVIQTQRARAKG